MFAFTALGGFILSDAVALRFSVIDALVAGPPTCVVDVALSAASVGHSNGSVTGLTSTEGFVAHYVLH